MAVTNRMVGWTTTVLVGLAGTAAIFALGSYSRTLMARAFALGALWLVAVVSGYSAYRMNRSAPRSGTWRGAVASMTTGAVVGVITFLVLWMIVFVAGAFAFEHSGFVW